MCKIRRAVSDAFACHQAALVEHCLQAVRAKDAWWLVREFSLHARFPGAEALYRRHTLRALAERQRWNAAVAFCADDAELQACILLQNPTPDPFKCTSHTSRGDGSAGRLQLHSALMSPSCRCTSTPP